MAADSRHQFVVCIRLIRLASEIGGVIIIICKMKHLISFSSERENEYSFDLHALTMAISGAEVMFITITRKNEAGDYTVILKWTSNKKKRL